MELLLQILGTVVLRPYFVAFFLAYFLACSLHLGVLRAVIFAIAGYAIAWLSEFSSIHCGFPYGYYYYIEATRGRELWVLGVPFMDSMSFVFLSYASYSLALMAVSPLIRLGGIYVLENRKIRYSLSVRLLGALFFVCLDIIIDPIALKGDRWFLGLIYGYREAGAYFGIPVSNFLGWLLVGVVLIHALQMIDHFLHRKGVKDTFGRGCSWRYLPGPLLYLGILAFNLAVTFWIGEYRLFWSGVLFVVLPLTLLIVLIQSKARKFGIAAARENHIRDFPGAAGLKAGSLIFEKR
jgi:uncharacterized membrane protein